MDKKTEGFLIWLDTQLNLAGWSDSMLARQAKVALSTIERIRAGKTRPSWNFLAKVAIALEYFPLVAFHKAGLMDAFKTAEPEFACLASDFSQSEDFEEADGKSFCLVNNRLFGLYFTGDWSLSPTGRVDIYLDCKIEDKRLSPKGEQSAIRLMEYYLGTLDNLSESARNGWAKPCLRQNGRRGLYEFPALYKDIYLMTVMILSMLANEENLEPLQAREWQWLP